MIISAGLNTCKGNNKYDARGDVNGDNCLTNTDLNYVQKYFGKNTADITQCQPGQVIQPTVSDANYKCPDINGDKTVNLQDTMTVSLGYGTCSGNAKYDARGDVNGDNCIDDTDLNYVQKYYGKKAGDVTQCQAALEASYKCPDINGDGTINLLDVTAVSFNLGACLGDAKYDTRGDVDGDNCLTSTDSNFINKNYGKNTAGIPQCQSTQVIQPTVSEANYKCPDINGDKTVNLQDTMTVSLGYGTCLGYAKYDPRGDVNGDNCINNTDLNYIQKYFGKNTADITQCLPGQVIQPTVSEANYKCPDINGDKVVDGSDTIIISVALNTCTGNTKYDARGDVNGDNCITDIDLNFVNKYFGKALANIAQCNTTVSYT